MMSLAIALYEDSTFTNFYPLCYTRPIFDLRCGILTLEEKFKLNFNESQILLIGRKNLGKIFTFNKYDDIEEDVEIVVFLNSKILLDASDKEIVLNASANNIFKINDEIVGFSVEKNNSGKYFNYSPEQFSNLELDDYDVIKLSSSLVNYPWEMVNKNGTELKNDFELISSKIVNKIKGNIYTGVHLLNKKDIYIGDGAIIKPGCVLDAENGPIFIGENTEIFPNVVIEGPCFIGRNSKIKTGAKIYENCSIGPVCKIGGEIEESIIHSYSNKQHDGFLGHSYLGCWVNLGADTNNSDLKNNYSQIRMELNGKQINTELQFVGAIIGDHSKTGINTMLNTGSIIGVSANIYGGSFPPKNIPSFSWGGSEGFVEYRFNKASEVAAKVCGRRNIEFDQNDEDLFKDIFNITSEERSNFLKKSS